MASFRALGSKRTLSFLVFGFTTITSEFTQSVGFVTFAFPFCAIRPSVCHVKLLEHVWVGLLQELRPVSGANLQSLVEDLYL